jgi:predicted secreted hydrolase
MSAPPTSPSRCGVQVIALVLIPASLFPVMVSPLSCTASTSSHIHEDGDAKTPGAAGPALSVLEALGGGAGADDQRFERATRPRELSFPADHGPHPGFRSEWWYWTGNLDGPDRRRFGYQLTIFRMALAPPPPPARSSAWATSQVYMAHLALTDVAGQRTGARFLADERTARGAVGLAGATAAPFAAWVLGWRASGPAGAVAAAGGDAPAATATATATATVTAPGLTPLSLRAISDGPRMPRFGIDLTLRAGKPLVLEGDRGLSRKGRAEGNASYYDSLTRMPTQGTVTIADQTFPVSGTSWMDREWSTSALEAGQVGWDWFALQLDDGRDLMFFRLRRRASPAAEDTLDPSSSGTLVARDGSAQHLDRDDVRVTATGSWTSPRSGTRYPAGFHLELPQAHLSLDVTPVVPDQELDLSFRYWEGAVDVVGTDTSTGTGTPIGGRGYLELTGYGEIASAGSPQSAR